MLRFSILLDQEKFIENQLVQCTLGKSAAGIGKPVAGRLEREDIITACPYCTGKAPVQAQDPIEPKI